MADKVDVIVVGAGPAGSAAALALAQKGVEVALLERGSKPGSKNMFGGIPLALVLACLSGDSSREGVEIHSNTSRTHHRDWCICNLDLARSVGMELSIPWRVKRI